MRRDQDTAVFILRPHRQREAINILDGFVRRIYFRQICHRSASWNMSDVVGRKPYRPAAVRMAV